MSGRLGTIVLFVALSTLVGCEVLGPRACTLVGCMTGLTVELEGSPTAPFTLTATADGATESIVCEEAGGCWLFFEDFTPSQVTVSYASGEDVVEGSFAPSYARSRPNGAGCPPECLNATVVLELP